MKARTRPSSVAPDSSCPPSRPPTPDTPAAVSQHLAKLRLARVVATRQEGTRVFYRLMDEHARQLVADAIFQAEVLPEIAPELVEES